MRKVLIVAGIAVVLLVGGALAYVALANPGKPMVKQQSTSNKQTSTSQSSVIVQTKTVSGIGDYLADGNGNALYTYGGDMQGMSHCAGSCLYGWPIYEATVTTNLPANVTIIERSDGSKQYAYKGMALYGFSGDSTGTVHGDGVSDFHVARP